MLDPKYLVNISWNPSRSNGQQLINIGGVTQSVPTYSDGYFVASMPEARISATGTSYTLALTNLLAIATASTTSGPGIEPYGNIRTW